MIKLFLIIIFLGCFSVLIADPSGSLTVAESAVPSKAQKKGWLNIVEIYGQCRNFAGGVAHQMKLTSDFAHSMENMLISWERVAKNTEILMSKKRWDDILNPNPIKLIENLEEKFFRPADNVLYRQIPSAIVSSRRYNESRQKWLEGASKNLPGFDYTKDKYTFIMNYLGLSPAIRSSMNQEKASHESRNQVMAKAQARSDIILTTSDNYDAQLDNMQERVGKAETGQLKDSDQGLQSMYELGSQEADNAYQIGNIEVLERMNNLELYSHIQLTKASGYAASATYTYRLLSSLVSFAEEAQAIKDQINVEKEAAKK